MVPAMYRLRVWRSIVIAVVIAFVEVRTAHACACSGDGLGGFTLPADGALDVPTNLRQLVTYSPMPSSEVLTSERGDVVLLEQPKALWGYYVFLFQVASELEPDTVYRWSRGSFRTGAGPDNEPPAALEPQPIIISLPHVPAQYKSCPRPSEMTTDFRQPVDAVLLGVRFIADSEVFEYTVEKLPRIGTGICDAWINSHEVAYDVEMWAYDLAGNAGPRVHTAAYVVSDGLGCAGCSTQRAPNALLLLGVMVFLRRGRSRR